jgi:hypothetical protein
VAAAFVELTATLYLRFAGTETVAGEEIARLTFAPLQIVEVVLVTEAAGVGSTTTVLVAVVPGHAVAPGPAGVIVYVTVTGPE